MVVKNSLKICYYSLENYFLRDTGLFTIIIDYMVIEMKGGRVEKF